MLASIRSMTTDKGILVFPGLPHHRCASWRGLRFRGTRPTDLALIMAIAVLSVPEALRQPGPFWSIRLRSRST